MFAIGITGSHLVRHPLDEDTLEHLLQVRNEAGVRLTAPGVIHGSQDKVGFEESIFGTCDAV